MCTGFKNRLHHGTILSHKNGDQNIFSFSHFCVSVFDSCTMFSFAGIKGISDIFLINLIFFISLKLFHMYNIYKVESFVPMKLMQKKITASGSVLTILICNSDGQRAASA